MKMGSMAAEGIGKDRQGRAAPISLDFMAHFDLYFVNLQRIPAAGKDGLQGWGRHWQGSPGQSSAHQPGPEGQ